LSLTHMGVAPDLLARLAGGVEGELLRSYGP
jgi:hypothetical protein